jgi:hypothetical protein
LLGYDQRDNRLLEASAVMLLRLDHDDAVPFDFVEAAAVYFMIEGASLDAGSFDEVTIAFGDVG